MKDRVAIVVLNWNGKSLLEKFIPKLIEHSDGAAIYIVDNCSTDDSKTFISNNYTSIEWLSLDKNYGYAGGYNLGLKFISQPYAVLINSDIEVTSNWLSPLYDKMESDDRIAMVQPKIKSYVNKDFFEYAGASGGFIDRWCFPYCRGRIFDSVEEDFGQYDDATEIFWASGACSMVRMSAFESVGGFDIDFFAHQEEIDLCWRFKNNDWSIWVVPSSIVFHVGGATLSESNPYKTYLNHRNSLLMMVKNLPFNMLFATLFSRLVLDGIAGVRLLFMGKIRHTLAIVRAHFGFYKRLPNQLKKRTSYQKKNYYQHNSIVWSYFILKKMTFKALN